MGQLDTDNYSHNLRPGEREIILLENGETIYLDDQWMKVKEMLEADKDRILAELRADKACQGKEAEEVQSH